MNIPLKKWIEDHPIDLDMRWASATKVQLEFVRDVLVYEISRDLDNNIHKYTCTVIGEHKSKSIVLPVYSINRPDWGLQLILRDNFYNWKMSVISDQPIFTNFSDIFYTRPPRDPDYTGDCLHPVYFEGFPSEFIFGYYEPSDKKRWSAEINNNYSLYMVVFMIIRALGHTEPKRQSIRK